jgi:hypothetical protein
MHIIVSNYALGSTEVTNVYERLIQNLLKDRVITHLKERGPTRHTIVYDDGSNEFNVHLIGDLYRELKEVDLTQYTALTELLNIGLIPYGRPYHKIARDEAEALLLNSIITDLQYASHYLQEPIKHHAVYNALKLFKVGTGYVIKVEYTLPTANVPSLNLSLPPNVIFKYEV